MVFRFHGNSPTSHVDVIGIDGSSMAPLCGISTDNFDMDMYRKEYGKLINNVEDKSMDGKSLDLWNSGADYSILNIFRIINGFVCLDIGSARKINDMSRSLNMGNEDPTTALNTTASVFLFGH